MGLQNSHSAPVRDGTPVSRSRIPLLVTVVVIIPIVGMVWLLVPLLRGREAHAPASRPVIVEARTPPPVTESAVQSTKPTPLPVPNKEPVDPVNSFVPPAEPALALSLSGLRTRIFGVVPGDTGPTFPGALPAPVGERYCVIDLHLQSDASEAIEIQFGPDAPTNSAVVLASPDGAMYRALGRARPVVDLVRPFDTAPITVSAQWVDEALRLVFLIPVSLQSTELRVADRLSVPVPIARPEPVIEAQSLSGTWIKATRQAWAVRYQDPLVDAIRRPGHTKLLITRAEETLRLEFPLIGIIGTATPAEGDPTGLYDLNLTLDDREVTGFVRFAQRGTVLVLYLGPGSTDRFVYVRP